MQHGRGLKCGHVLWADLLHLPCTQLGCWLFRAFVKNLKILTCPPALRVCVEELNQDRLEQEARFGLSLTVRRQPHLLVILLQLPAQLLQLVTHGVGLPQPFLSWGQVAGRVAYNHGHRVFGCF